MKFLTKLSGDTPMRILDLFSGIGGFSLGLERAGMKTVAFCEIEPFCQRVLAKHWPGVPCYNDIRALTARRLQNDGITVEAMCGGFPCQDVSSAGKKAGIDGERSGLWREYSRLIGELRPEYVIVENVSGLLSNGMGRVLGDLAALGYDAEWHCIQAADVGAPHIRDRVWIIAYPQKRMRNGVLLSGQINVQSSFQGFKRLRSVICARLDRNEAPADFRRLRKDDGLSARLDDIAAFGNAVVPQIPEMIGRAILAAEARVP